MNRKIASFCATVILAASFAVQADDAVKTKPASAEFERMKSLIGSWKGKTDMGPGPIEVTLQYRLLAGGSVLEERVFAGTPNEMITMYYDQGGKLALTHYCVLGNRPAMLLKAADSKSLIFDFDATCGVNASAESHMHAVTITFDDPDTITTSCKAFINGKEADTHSTTLKRVKS